MKILKRILKIVALFLGTTFIIAIVSLTIILEPNFRIYGWQNLDDTKLKNINRTLTILDDNQNIIADNIYDNNKIYTPIEKISQTTINAFISVEDKRFFSHAGIDYFRIGGAIKANLFSKTFKEGASTITQQLIKNTHLNSDKTLKRKIQELRISKALERKYSKKQILEMYLNILYFGNNIYGIGTASKLLYNKQVEDLDLNESATLAGIINNPTKYNPYTNLHNTTHRRNLVLKQMLELKKISKNQYEKTLKTNINISKKMNNINIQYINSVLREASIKLNTTEEDLFKYGYTIETNLNMHKQKHVSLTMRDIVKDTSIISHAIILENSSGNIVCDYSESNLNLSYIRRQPGSTIKPLLCYAPAFEKKLIYPSSYILDKQMSFYNYSPSNYNNKYYGYTTIRESLKQSMNIPAVKLLEMNGIEYSKKFLKNCGIKFSQEDNSLALALGGFHNGLRLAEIANLYQVLGNSGKFLPCSYIKSIKNSNGKKIYYNNYAPKKIISDDTSYLITNILEDCLTSGTAKKMFGLKNVAAKTGTVGESKYNTDAYCIAYTQDFTIAVWFGSKNNKTINTISGGGLPTICAGTIINNLNLNSNKFIVPNEIVYLEIDSTQEKNHKIMLAGNDIPKKNCKTEIFSSKNTPTQYSYNFEPDIFNKDFLELYFNYRNYNINS